MAGSHPLPPGVNVHVGLVAMAVSARVGTGFIGGTVNCGELGTASISRGTPTTVTQHHIWDPSILGGGRAKTGPPPASTEIPSSTVWPIKITA